MQDNLLEPLLHIPCTVPPIFSGSSNTFRLPLFDGNALLLRNRAKHFKLFPHLQMEFPEYLSRGDSCCHMRVTAKK